MVSSLNETLVNLPPLELTEEEKFIIRDIPGLRCSSLVRCIYLGTEKDQEAIDHFISYIEREMWEEFRRGSLAPVFKPSIRHRIFSDLGMLNLLVIAEAYTRPLSAIANPPV